MPETGVSILGWGAVTALGSSWETTRRALMDGEVGPRPETVHSRGTCLARAEHLENQPGEPRFTRLARRALEDLIDRTGFPGEGSLGLVASSSKGNWGEEIQSNVTGPGNPGIWAGQLARRWPEQIKRVASPTTACATGLSAVLQASRWIADGEVDQALVVAAESCFSPLLLAGYQNLGVLCDGDGMRPFHPNRSGFALGEAAAALWLGAPDFSPPDGSERGRILGWAETCDAHHITNMEESGTRLRKTLRTTLHRSRVDSTSLDLLHAHLTTTQDNDRTEANLLGEWKGSPCLQGVKPSLGHTIGTSGLLEVIATAHSLETGELFPLVRSRKQDVPMTVRDGNFPNRERPRLGLSWNMGFGGHNAAVCLRSR